MGQRPADRQPADRQIERQAQIDTQSIVAAQAGPACVATADRRILVANQAWQDLGLPTPEEPGVLPGQLALAILATSHNDQARHLGLTLEVGDETVTIEFTCLPLTMGTERVVITLGRDRSATRDLLSALVGSRQFLREMSMHSTDFNWRVDAGQRFTYAGDQGILDYCAHELIGTKVADLLDPQSLSAGDRVFAARDPVSRVEIWLRAKSGARHCFLISAKPVFDDQGNWCGTQGDGHEFTEEWARREEIASARRSQRQVDSVLYSMHGEVDPDAILGAAVSATIDAGDLAACVVAKVDTARRNSAMEIRSSGACCDQTRSWIEAHIPAILGLCEGVALHAEEGLVQAMLGGYSLLLGPTSNKQKVNGVTVFVRRAVEDETAHLSHEAPSVIWTEDDYRLIRAVTDQLGVALAQLDLVRSLTRPQPRRRLDKTDAK